MKALFIGRFQPFHNGHLKVIQNDLKKYDEIIIGIGSSQYGHTVDNPFTADERKKMIEETLNKKGVTNYTIVLIPDIHNPPKWVDHVLSIFSNFDVVFTNSDLTKYLFSEKGFKVIQPPLYSKENFSGREIRRRIKKGESWEECVPSEVVSVINKIDGVKRIKDLF
jgi:nicotinamide-nucleotide adenylyltransferase